MSALTDKLDSLSGTQNIIDSWSNGTGEITNLSTLAAGAATAAVSNSISTNKTASTVRNALAAVGSGQGEKLAANMTTKALSNIGVTGTVASANTLLSTAQSTLLEGPIIAAELIDAGMKKIEEKAQSELKMALTKMMSINTSAILSYSQTYISTYTKSTKQALIDALTDQDEKAKEEQKKAQEERKNKKINNIKEKAGKAKEDITKAMTDAQESMNFVTNNINKGSEWVMNKIDDYTNITLNTIHKQINTATQAVESEKNAMYEVIGTEAGKQATAVINDAIDNATRAMLNKQNQQKSKAKVKAKTSIANAKLKIAAMLGG